MDIENYNNLTREELATQLTVAQRNIDGLEREKRKVGVSFRRIPESGYQIAPLYNGDFPYFQHIPALSYTLDDRHKDETLAKKSLSTSTDGNITLIEGDNLPVLVALQLTHKGRVDVIYIDPPYNTGNNDFIYNDNRKSSISDIEGASVEDYETTLDGKSRIVGKNDGERHSLWLSFMEKRLYLARELLSKTGVIFVSIDDNEQARLKLLMDNIFGEQNFIANVVWNGVTKNNARFISTSHDYMLFYMKNKDGLSPNKNWREKKKGVKDALLFIQNITEKYNSMILKTELTYKEATIEANKELVKFLKPYDESIKRYNKLDLKKGATYRNDIPLSAPNSKAFYDVIHPSDNLPCKLPPSGWAFKRAVMEEKIKNHLINFGSSYRVTPQGIKYLEGDLLYQVATSFFYRTRGPAKEELLKIVGHGKFDFPKNVEIIKRWLGIVAPKNAIILDFFAGSGTTGHAVAELNEEDGGSRQCILVTHGDENGKNIAEDVTAQRMLRVLSGKNWADGKIREGLNGEFNYYKLLFAPKFKNSMSAIETMQSKFVGYAALQQDVVLNLQKSSDQQYSVLENSTKIVVVVENEEYLREEIDDDLRDKLNELKIEAEKYSLKSNIYKQLIIYIPSEIEEYYTNAFSVLEWEYIYFPIEYIEGIETTINGMKKNKTLIPVSKDPGMDFSNLNGEANNV